MILISHRGNTNGRIVSKENHPDYINEAIGLGFDVEIDLWLVDENIFLGHDLPQYKINLDWINERIDKLWLHCKNVEILEFLSKQEIKPNYFWHENDVVTLTSKNYIWAYPNKQPIENSIAVMPEINNDDTTKCIGICSDFIEKYKI